VFPDLVFFGLIFRPNFLGPTLTGHISRTARATGAKFAAFLNRPALYKTRYTGGRYSSPLGQGSPANSAKKIEISKLKPSLAGSGGKCFRGFGPGPANVLGMPIG